MYRNFVNDLLPHDKKFIPTTFVSQLLSNHSFNGVSKLYRFSSNNPSSIALISVVMLSAHADPIIVDIGKRTQGNMLRVEPTQGEVSCMRLIKNRVFTPHRNKRRAYLSCTKDVEALYHAMRPLSRPQSTAPRFTWGGRQPLVRVFCASGLALLQACVHVPSPPQKNKTNRLHTQSRKPRRRHRACSHPQTLGLSR